MKTLTVVASFVLSAAATVIACSESSISTPDGSSSGSTGTTGGAGGKSSAANSSNGKGNGNGNAASAGDGIARTGTVSVTQSYLDGSFFWVSAAASFSDAPDAGAPASATPSCTSSTEGPCSIVDCVDNGAAPTIADAGTTKAPHAGAVKLEGLRAITLTPDDHGMYPDTEANDAPALYESGGSVKFSAPGADVPAFETTLPAPSLITVTSPAMEDGSFEVSPNEDLTVAWDHGAAGDVSMTLSTQGEGRQTTVSCTFKAAAGTGVIPSAAIGRLDTTGTVVAKQAQVTSSTSTVVEQGGWKITASLRDYVAADLFKVKH